MSEAPVSSHALLKPHKLTRTIIHRQRDRCQTLCLIRQVFFLEPKNDPQKSRALAARHALLSQCFIRSRLECAALYYFPLGRVRASLFPRTTLRTSTPAEFRPAARNCDYDSTTLQN